MDHRRRRPFRLGPLVLSLLFAASGTATGCTVLTDFSECEVDGDCAVGICNEGICQREVPCTERAQCASVSEEAYCLAGNCRVIDRARCPRLGEVFTSDAEGIILPIGALMPLSGTNQIKGEAASDGAELALRQINANGGSTAGKFGLIVCDTQYEAERAVDQARYLHQQLGVIGLVGAISSAETLAVVDQVATPEQVVVISPASTSPGLSGRSEYFWRTIPSDALQAPAMAELLADRGIQRAALLYGGEQDPYGSGFSSTLNFYWASNPAQKPATLRFGVFDTSAPATSLQAVNATALKYGTSEPKPEAIILVGSLVTSDLLVAVEANYVQSLPEGERPLWVLPESMRDRALLAQPGVKPAFSRIIGTAPLRAETPIFANYETLMQVTFNRNALDYQFPDKAYDAAFLLAVAYGAQPDPLSATGAELNAVLQRISSDGPESNLLGTEYSAIAGALRDGQQVNVVGVSGALDFDATREIPTASIATWQIDTSGPTPTFVEAMGD